MSALNSMSRGLWQGNCRLKAQKMAWSCKETSGKEWDHSLRGKRGPWMKTNKEKCTSFL
jgi:hypothetical protein